MNPYFTERLATIKPNAVKEVDQEKFKMALSLCAGDEKKAISFLKKLGIVENTAVRLVTKGQVAAKEMAALPAGNYSYGDFADHCKAAFIKLNPQVKAEQIEKNEASDSYKASARAFVNLLAEKGMAVENDDESGFEILP